MTINERSAQVRASGPSTVLTFEDAMRLEGICRRTVWMRVRRGLLRTARTGRRLANYKAEVGVVVASLSAAARRRLAFESRPELRPRALPPGVRDDLMARLADSARARLEPAAPATPQPRQVALFEPGSARPDHLPQHIPITRDGLPDLEALRQMGLHSQADAYEHRFRAVSRLRAALHGAEHGHVLAVRHRVAQEFGVCESTLRNWCRAVKTWGWVGLMSGHGRTRGQHPSIPLELQKQILDAFAYQGEYAVAQIYRHVVEPWYANDGRMLPHPGTIRRFIRQNVPPIIEAVSRRGSRAYEEQHEPRVIRDLESAGVNGWWVSDHRLADTMVLVPDGKGTGWPSKVRSEPCTCGSAKRRRECCSIRRLWWTVVVDVCSAAIVGWRFSVTPTASTVCHVLHQAILSFGLPQNWLRDNGKEFTARRLNGATLDLRSPAESDLGARKRWPAVMPREVEGSTMWELLGVRVVSTLPYSAWSKYAETVFSAFSRRFENLLPGWTGRSSSAKPEKLKAELLEGALLTADQYVEGVTAQIKDWNEARPIGGRRMPPAKYYEGHVAHVLDGRTLTFLLQARRRQRIRHGRIVLDDRLYVSDQLAPYGGVQVDIRFDPGEPEWIWVYPGDGRCIAVQHCPKARYGEWGEANRRVASARRAQKQFIREWAAPIKGTCPADGLDPTGLHRAVQQRIAGLRDTEIAASRQTLALEEAKVPEDEKPDSHRTPYQVAKRKFREQLFDAFESAADTPKSHDASCLTLAAHEARIVEARETRAAEGWTREESAEADVRAGLEDCVISAACSADELTAGVIMDEIQALWRTGRLVGANRMDVRVLGQLGLFPPPLVESYALDFGEPVVAAADRDRFAQLLVEAT